MERSAGREQPQAWHSEFLAYETPQDEHPSKSARTKSGIVRNWEKLLRGIFSERPTIQFGNTRRPAHFTWTLAAAERDSQWILQVVIASRASRRYAMAPPGQKERADRLLLRLVGNSRETCCDLWEAMACGSVPVVGLAISEGDLFPSQNQSIIGWATRK